MIFMEELFGVITEAVFTILGVLLAAGVSYFVPKLKRRLDILADKDNSGIITTVVDMAVDLAESELSGEAGAFKFARASEYTSEMLRRYGIEVSPEFVKGAVQTGWRRMNEEQKGDVIHE